MHLFSSKGREYTRQSGNIRYLDGDSLARPASIPGVQKLLVLFFVLAALALSFLVINNTVLAMEREVERSSLAVVDNLKRQQSIDTVPLMSEMVQLSDEEILGHFAEQGFQLYDASAASGLGGFAVYKIPSDMTIDEASALYLRGLNSLNAEQGSKLLVGSWYFSADHDYGTMVVRYSDFRSGTIEAAMNMAMTHQGIPAESVIDSGIDEAGNTYRTGQIEIADTLYKWQISALPLEDMYNISGLPEDAVYLGIRFTQI